ncbi:hypothetical protein PSR1_03947 [Anaeromyxobacter sp. PSR-1]|nr:hypothetical protein PSR1_03947 [Anaeromyxobacter sp. PSR-1]
MTPSRSCAASGSAFCVSTERPSAQGVRQARWSGRPSTRTRQLPQEPARQNGPRGRWYLALRARSGRPAASSAEAIDSPRRAGTALPSKVMVQSAGKSGSLGMVRALGGPEAAGG